MQHRRICEFPSKMFYENELQTDHNITAGFIQIKKFWPQGRENPLVFCNIDGREGGAVSGNKKSSLLSKSNADEAKKVVRLFVSITFILQAAMLSTTYLYVNVEILTHAVAMLSVIQFLCALYQYHMYDYIKHTFVQNVIFLA